MGRTIRMTRHLGRLILLAFTTTLLAACATTPEQQASRDGDRCAQRGHQRGSKSHDDCITRLESERDRRIQERHRELVERPALPPAFNR